MTRDQMASISKKGKRADFQSELMSNRRATLLHTGSKPHLTEILATLIQAQPKDHL